VAYDEVYSWSRRQYKQSEAPQHKQEAHKQYQAAKNTSHRMQYKTEVVNKLCTLTRKLTVFAKKKFTYPQQSVKRQEGKKEIAPLRIELKSLTWATTSA
jgi:hypothetical protein